MRSETNSRSGALVLLFVTLVGPCVFGQRGADIGPLDGMGPASTFSPVDAEFFLMDVYRDQAQKRHDQLEQPTEGVSKLDLKAPGKARDEYEKGVQFLLAKNFPGAVERLAKATSIYPKFVAAHNALGSAYMELTQPEKARDEFQQAVSLDDHLPNSFANLCAAELTLKHYPEAEQAIKRASSISPLNVDLLTTLTFTQVQNHHYQDAIATAQRVHAGKHENAAMVHWFAAAAWREEKNLPEMQHELETYLAEDPKSPSAEKARQLIAQITDIQNHPKLTIMETELNQSTAIQLASQREERRQVAEAEAMCVGCGSAETAPSPAKTEAVPTSASDRERFRRSSTGWVLRKSVDEVDLFFAAIDHGKTVSDLDPKDVVVRDDLAPPASILGFRNESQLPLRLGLVIDTSESITSRFAFELESAAGFLQKVLTNKDDLAFVVGFSNSILLVQDYTADQKQLSHGIGELAPAGGTALWDAVGFASQQLGNRLETQPVARILVVISDGADNSSTNTLKQAIQAADRANVVVYTVSTEEASLDSTGPSVGTRALRALSDQTGGTFFAPGSVSNLKRSLTELQQVIRSRYMISYKPARFQADGRYRKIDLTAQKAGRKLRVYTRKGYYAREAAPNEQAVSDSSYPATASHR
jgi:Ca-activated chloride channel homolog